MRLFQNTHPTRSTMRDTRTVLLALVLFFASACDTKVTNPGRFEDNALGNRNAAAAMVAGAGRALSSAMNWIGYTGAAVTREIHPAGSTGSFGITPPWQDVRMIDDRGARLAVTGHD